MSCAASAPWVKSAMLLRGSGAQLPALAFGEDRPRIHTAGNSMPSLSPRQLDPHRPGAPKRECKRGRAGLRVRLGLFYLGKEREKSKLSA